MKGSMKVTPIEGKIIEARLRWYGHVMRRDDDGMSEKNLEEATVQDIRFWRLIVRTADTK
jgi:hypothetical protein